MKKIFTLIAVAFACVAGAQAQNVIISPTGNVNSDGTGTYLGATLAKASDIKSIEVLPADTADVVKEADGSYTGLTSMKFDMMAITAGTIDGNTDTLKVNAIGGSWVSMSFASEMGAAILANNHAYVKGTFYHINVTETSDSLVFDNRQADGTKVDYVQASMQGPVTASTKYYPCNVYGSIEKASGKGIIHIDTAFGAMGGVYFTITTTAKEAAKEE